MSYPKRKMIAAAAIGLLAITVGGEQPRANAFDAGSAVAKLVRQSETANAALMRGDIRTYFDLTVLSDDFTLMSPFGGKPTRGGYTRKRWIEIGEFYRNGTLKQELVQAYTSGDLVVLAVIEHGHGEVGGMPPQEWPLRVTLVYRRLHGQWQIVHRHADPLVKELSLEQSAELARGGGEAL